MSQKKNVECQPQMKIYITLLPWGPGTIAEEWAERS